MSLWSDCGAKELTYKATDPIIDRLVSAGFVERRLMRPEDSGKRRRLFVTTTIDQFLNKGSVTEMFPHIKAAQVNEMLMSGYMITMTRSVKNTSATLKLLQGVPDMWALKYPVPRPGWRLIGRFPAKDVFVGLRLIDRAKGNYEVEVQGAASDWNKLLGSVDFVSTGVFTDYVSGQVYDVDAKGK